MYIAVSLWNKNSLLEVHDWSALLFTIALFAQFDKMWNPLFSYSVSTVGYHVKHNAPVSPSIVLILPILGKIEA